MKIAASLTTLALLAATGTAHAEDPLQNRPTDLVGVPVAPEASDTQAIHYPPPIVRLGLIGFGLLITGGAWGIAYGSASAWPTVPGSAGLKIPVVGPWIALGKSGCATDDPTCGGATIGVRGALYVLDGIAQIAGLALIAEGIVMKTEPAAKKKASGLPSLRLRGVEVSAIPLTSPTMQGIGLVGTF